MARRVFFSFHFKHDNWRVGQVRNSWIGQKGEANQFLDAAAWEQIERKGADNVKRWIDKEMNGTGVTVVLIGTYTAGRPYVRYEIQQSTAKGSGLLGIYIHKIRDRNSQMSLKGKNPLDDFFIEKPSPWLGIMTKYRLSDVYKTYDWVYDEGRKNMAAWIEEAARIAGR